MNKAFKANKKWKATRYYRLYCARRAARIAMSTGTIAAGYAAIQQIKTQWCPIGENQALFKIKKAAAISETMIKTFEATNRILKGEV